MELIASTSTPKVNSNNNKDGYDRLQKYQDTNRRNKNFYSIEIYTTRSMLTKYQIFAMKKDKKRPFRILQYSHNRNLTRTH